MSQVQRSTTPPRSTHASYHPGGYGVSEGLRRARRPYFWKNAVTGGLILSFATGVYYYSISKVKQDDFSDLANLTAESSSSAGESVKQAASSLSTSLYSASDRVQEAAASAASKSSQHLASAQSSLASYSNSAQSALHDASASTAQTLSRLAEQAQQTGAQARDSAVQAGREVQQAVAERVPAALEPRDDARNRLRELILLAQGRSL
ncbi:hypothetical protein OC844_005928 [Tilletia horrida]|nr:hypothetical protein OC844_005928 [Tilletia horrida]